MICWSWCNIYSNSFWMIRINDTPKVFTCLCVTQQFHTSILQSLETSRTKYFKFWNLEGYYHIFMLSWDRGNSFSVYSPAAGFSPLVFDDLATEVILSFLLMIDVQNGWSYNKVEDWPKFMVSNWNQVSIVNISATGVILWSLVMADTQDGWLQNVW